MNADTAASCDHHNLEAVMVYRTRIGPDDRLWECMDCDQVVDRNRNPTGITRSDLDAHFAPLTNGSNDHG